MRFFKENYPWLIGLWSTLTRRMQDGQLPHAILLTGVNGSGRHILAEKLATFSLCDESTSLLDQGITTACGNCRSCNMLATAVHPDYFVLESDDDSSQIKVDQVRGLLENLTLSAGRSGYRVALIRNAEQLNTSAANALLKTLEEPGKQTLLILVSSHPGQLPATIFSRCQHWAVSVPDNDMAKTYLSNRIPGSEHYELALQLAGGGPLLAAEYIEQEWVQEAEATADSLNSLRQQQLSLNDVVQQTKIMPAERCWRWFGFWLHRWLLDGQLLNSSALMQLYQQAVWSEQQSGSGLRYELQLHAWLLQWQKITAS